MSSRALVWILVVAFTAGSLGCRGRRSARSGGERNLGQAAPVAAALVAETAMSEAAAAEPVYDEDYRLAPRDQVVFEMFNEPDVKTTQRLSSQGEVTLPLAGTISLAGMTLREAEEEIRRRYFEGGFYTDPHVILAVSEYGAHYVTVLGQVNRPDRIELPIETSTMGLIDAITQAGGFTRVARTDSVQVTRQTAQRTERHLTIDVREFLGRRGAEDFQLQPGDVVFVPERVF
jgi:protein involved in polysaccharide export with SLBB domain